MTGIYIPDNHVFMTACTDVTAICEPVLLKYGISFFLRARMYNDNSSIGLLSDAGWTKHFFENIPHVGPPPLPKNSGVISYFTLWENHVNDLLIIEARKFNIFHPFSFIEVYPDYVEFYAFGANQDNSQIINFYINNIDFLKKFILYFNEKSEKIWQTVSQTPLIIPDELRAKPLNEKALANIKKHDDLYLTQQIPLYGKLGKAYLTKREHDTLKQLLSGKRIKEVGLQLGISPRTVEVHLNHIKQKLGCCTTSQVLKLLDKNDILFK